MEGVTLGVVIGAGTTIISTLLASGFNLIVAKKQHEREMKKNFVARKITSYENVCKVVAEIGINDSLVMLNTSNAGLQWAKKSIKEINALYVNECLWLDEHDLKPIEELQDGLAQFIFPEKEETCEELRQKCYAILRYCSNKAKELHSTSDKTPWWKLR